MTRLADLWAGRLPLSTAFWGYAIFWGFFVNIAAIALSLVLVLTSNPSGNNTQANLPIYFAVLANVLPVFFNGAVLVGVWRSADRPENSTVLSVSAKLAIAAWAVALFFAHLIIP